MSAAASRRSGSRSRPAEGNENELGTPLDPHPLRPPRSPLSSIQDPSRIPKDGPPTEPGSSKTENNASDPKQRLAADNPTKGAGATPRSALSTPARSTPRIYNGSGREKGCSSKVLSAVVDAKSLVSVEVPRFDLKEDPSFWKDHNVQVLIRIRPISGAEIALQGYKRSLVQESSQTLTWAGHPETRFTFDHVACENMSQEKLFKVVGLPMVENCMSGYNSCMFAYGQTGSGKTYTMMGEIREMDNSLSEDRGMTPRIFEYLFTRIKEEEEIRSGEQLKYSCKCSFLEIYNEQITDLLEPSSTNLQLREDIKKGVYVENLKEYEVSSVKDVFELLLQGAANRKMAATHMNSESSRSHSVFTCVIESRWEKDSMTHLRFGRLNLVDLAGSERQKSSGAEGERLKEAANINRSLSTLGLVIMTLVDIANGKHRHVPYRDSRLTFLLQDSLGGNSKTTIIANVSPSICSASETLSTLKFAQRAKLIQNNAQVNEDASGDVIALQQQIQKLKDQLTFITKHQNIPRSLCYPSHKLDQANSGDIDDVCNSSLERNPDTVNNLSLLYQKINYLEATLTGALRREKMTEAVARRLEAEIRHMKRLVHQREDDAQQIKATLKFREEKLKRLELLADDLISSDGYLMEENASLSEEIQLLRERIDRNPELTQFALENMRLLEQLRMFQEFYQQGERETLLAEISHLRNQLLKILEGRFALANGEATQNDDTIKELDSCRRQLGACLKYNATLVREVDDLRCQLRQYQNVRQATICSAGETSRDDYRIQETDKQSPVELKLVEGDLEEITSFDCVNIIPNIKSDQWMGDIVSSQFSNVQKELRDARFLIETMESQQLHLIEELDNLKQENCIYLELLKCKEHDGTHAIEQIELHSQMLEVRKRVLKRHNLDTHEMTECGDTANLALIGTLEKMHKDLEDAKILNKQLLHDQASQLTYQHAKEHVPMQDEAETAETNLYLPEEFDVLQQEVNSMDTNKVSATYHYMTEYKELHNRLCFLVQENMRLSNLVAARDVAISTLSADWEKAIIELTSFLIDGWRSLEDASDCIGTVVDSFPQRNEWINEHVERAIKVFIEKEKLIANLKNRLEDAQKMGLDMKSKLNSLKGATLAITEVQQLENDENSKELFHLGEVLREKVLRIQELENIVQSKENAVMEADKNAKAAYLVIKKLYAMNTSESLNVGVVKSMINELVNENFLVIRDCNSPRYETEIHQLYTQGKDVIEVNPKVKLSLLVEQDCVRVQERNAEEAGCSSDEIKFQVEMAIRRVLDANDIICTSYADTKKYLDGLISDINSTAAAFKMLIHDLINEFRSINKNFRAWKEQRKTAHSIVVESLSFEAYDLSKTANQSTVMKIMFDRLVVINETLSDIKTVFDSLFSISSLAGQEHNICPRMNLQPVCKNHGSDMFEQYADLIPNAALLLYMMEESKLGMNFLMELHFQLGMILDRRDVTGCSAQGVSSDMPPAIGTNSMVLRSNQEDPSDPLTKLELCQTLQTLEDRLKEIDASSFKTRQTLWHKLNHARHDAQEKTKLTNGLFLKIEEAQETMEEAELVLNALTKANEDAKHDRDWWKQASEELMAERIALTEEVKRLEASNFSEAKQYDFLHDQIHASLVDILGLISSLQGSFQQTQQIMGEELNASCFDIASLGQELLQCICTSRSGLEDIMSEIMEKDFALFVLYQCHIGAYTRQIMHLSVDSSSIQYTCDEPFSVVRNVENTYLENPDGSMTFKGLKDNEVIQNHQTLIFSGLRETVEVKGAFRTVPHAAVRSIATANIANIQTLEFSCDQRYLQEKVAKLEKEKFELTHDMGLVKETISNLAKHSDSLMQDVSAHKEVLESASFPMAIGKSERVSFSGKSTQINTSVYSCARLSDLWKDLGSQSEIVHDNTKVFQGSEIIHEESTKGVTADIEVLFTAIQHLKGQLAQLITLHLAAKNNSQESSLTRDSVTPEYVQQGETNMPNSSTIMTEYGNQIINTLNKLWNNLQLIINKFHPGLHVDTDNRQNKSLLDRVFQGICSIEDKACMLLEKCSRNTMIQVDAVTDNSLLAGKLARKDNVVNGQFFDIKLFQESTSNIKNIKDKNEEMVAILRQVQDELANKTSQVDNILVEQKMLEAKLAGTDAALSSSRSEMEQAQKKLVMLSNENTELRRLLENNYVKRSCAEGLLEDKRKVVEGLEREIVSINYSFEGNNLSSIEDIIDELRRVSNERDQLCAEIGCLNDKLEMASAFADENEAIAVEARQVAEASKIYAEEKEEEVKILERSIEELEDTINILEQKVCDMKEEVESYQLIRKGLIMEVQALTQRMLTVENAAEVLISEDSNVEGGKSQMLRRLDDRIIELYEARKRIEDLETEKTYKIEEIERYREHISELVLHSEAQSSLYQEKFKALESMVSMVKPDLSTSNTAGPTANSTEKHSVRTRGSGSPFRCLTSLVQQMNYEKDQELSLARFRIEELEALAATKQKEVCMLTARLAAVDSMTHDVIRDLLGVKLDMTNYANFIDREQLQKLLEKAQEQSEESKAKEKEILDVKEQINHLIEERDSWVEEINQRKADMLANQLTVERLKQRDQLLTAQNELLKIDKANLHRKIAELDEQLRLLIGSNSIYDQTQKSVKIKENSSQRVSNQEFSRRLAQSDKFLSHARN